MDKQFAKNDGPVSFGRKMYILTLKKIVFHKEPISKIVATCVPSIDCDHSSLGADYDMLLPGAVRPYMGPPTPAHLKKHLYA